VQHLRQHRRHRRAHLGLADLRELLVPQRSCCSAAATSPPSPRSRAELTARAASGNVIPSSSRIAPLRRGVVSLNGLVGHREQEAEHAEDRRLDPADPWACSSITGSGRSPR
jgi:hypothetical protein